MSRPREGTARWRRSTRQASPHQEPGQRHLDRGLPASRPGRNQCLLCKPPSLWYLLWPPELTNKVAQNTLGVSEGKEGAGQSLGKTMNPPERDKIQPKELPNSRPIWTKVNIQENQVDRMGSDGTGRGQAGHHGTQTMETQPNGLERLKHHQLIYLEPAPRAAR